MENTQELKEKGKTIYEKLFNIMSAVNEIGKDKRNEFHGYNYVSEYVIKKTIHEQLVSQGVLFKLDILERGSIEVKLKDKITYLTTIKVQYWFINVEDGKDTVSGTFIADGGDSLDKGIYKAITGAIKYILTSTFLIPTGDDVEKFLDNDNPKNHVCADCGKKISVEAFNYCLGVKNRERFENKSFCLGCQKNHPKKY